MADDDLWNAWAHDRRWLPPAVREKALREVSSFLAQAPDETLVPLMTRCRAFPAIARVSREFDNNGIAAIGVCWFFSHAPIDYRVAFNLLRMTAR